MNPQTLTEFVTSFWGGVLATIGGLRHNQVVDLGNSEV